MSICTVWAFCTCICNTFPFFPRCVFPLFSVYDVCFIFSGPQRRCTVSFSDSVSPLRSFVLFFAFWFCFQPPGCLFYTPVFWCSLDSGCTTSIFHADSLFIHSRKIALIALWRLLSFTKPIMIRITWRVVNSTTPGWKWWPVISPIR